MSFWDFHPCVTQSRRDLLVQYLSFSIISDSIMLVADVESFSWEPFNGHQLKGCRRASFLLRVPGELYDLYFNSPQGYRAQYARSTATGDAANRALLTTLSTRFIAQGGSPTESNRILRSMSGVQAKTWIDEGEVQGHFYSDDPEIDFPRWAGGIGLRAPLGRRLVAYGGWLDRSGNEMLNPFKVNRSQEIHEYGFS